VSRPPPRAFLLTLLFCAGIFLLLHHILDAQRAPQPETGLRRPQCARNQLASSRQQPVSLRPLRRQEKTVPKEAQALRL
jgi:hypothetical protein